MLWQKQYVLCDHPTQSKLDCTFPSPPRYVLMDNNSATTDSTCRGLVTRLLGHHSMTGRPSISMPILTCHVRSTTVLGMAKEVGQPRVGELLEFASTHAHGTEIKQESYGPAFAGRIVVLSNADVVFDESIMRAPTLLTDLTHKDALVFTVTHGPNKSVYDKVHNVPADRRDNNGDLWLPKTSCPGWKRGVVPWTWSWDAFMFVPPLPHLDPARTGHFMNEMSGEHRTAEALHHAGLTIRNACMLTRLQHYHIAPKMHHGHHPRQNKLAGVPDQKNLPPAFRCDSCCRGFPPELRTYPCTFFNTAWKERGFYVVDTTDCETCAEQMTCWP